MSKVVLDASALLALLNDEPGGAMVEKHLNEAVMSAVNVSEVITVLNNIGISIEEAQNSIFDLVKHIEPFDEYDAVITAALRSSTKSLGLSLGDRACLALAKKNKLPVLTADKESIPTNKISSL